MAQDIITVAADTKLRFVDTTPTTDIYAEEMFGHETGNYVEVAAGALPATVLDAYLAPVAV